LADKSGVGFSSMQRLESAAGVPGAQFKTLEAIKDAFEKALKDKTGVDANGNLNVDEFKTFIVD
jgi:ADP-ribose pyrophosphatase YjhB (NUDIX family)